jgi:hypothetical protein
VLTEQFYEPELQAREVVMDSFRLTFREMAIGLGLLRPLRTAEENDALRKCTAYLDCRMRSGSTLHTLLDRQLAVAFLERWLTL